MEGNKSMGIFLASVAGTMAALGSASAKLALTANVIHEWCLTSSVLSSLNQTEHVVCDMLSNILRAVCFGGMFVFNALMWTFYTKSLQYSSSTVEATITNTGSNFLITALVGITLFGERLSLFWWIGSCLIFAGLVFIHKGSQEAEDKVKQHSP